MQQRGTLLQSHDSVFNDNITVSSGDFERFVLQGSMVA